MAVLAYLWRLARGEKWAGAHGSAWFRCSLAQLVIGLAPIMGWRAIPDRGTSRRCRVRPRHRKSVQRWLDWLALAGLVEHTPQQDEEGFWWRTVIRLRPLPRSRSSVLEEAVERRRGWPARERRRRDALRGPPAAGAEPDRDPAPRPAEPRGARQRAVAAAGRASSTASGACGWQSSSRL